jgi:reactive intermediate/imine deaminase
MAKITINPQGVSKPDPDATYSQGTRVGNLIFISGQTARDASGTIVGKGDIHAQARQVFENIKTVLASQGASMDDVVKRNLYLKNIKHLPEVYKVMAQYFPNPKAFPACACIEAAELADPDYLLEIDVVATKQ